MDAREPMHQSWPSSQTLASSHRWVQCGSADVLRALTAVIMSLSAGDDSGGGRKLDWHPSTDARHHCSCSGTRACVRDFPERFDSHLCEFVAQPYTAEFERQLLASTLASLRHVAVHITSKHSV